MLVSPKKLGITLSRAIQFSKITALVFAGAYLFLLNVNTVKAQDKTLLQGFYWDVTPGGVWYDTLAYYAPYFGKMGITGVWFPSPAKGANGPDDVGYTPYDYYDVGEFNSAGGDATSENGSLIATRYGTRTQLENALAAFKFEGIASYADAVLNHRSGGTKEPNQYKQWYVNRGGSLYGVNDSTYTAFPLTNGSGRIAFPIGEGNEFFYPNASVNPNNTGDFFSDAQFGYFQMYTNSFAYDVALHDNTGNNLPFGDSLSVWSNWLLDEIGFDGFRVDFVKGIHPEYLKRWADYGSNKGKFVVAELYDGSNDRLKDWLNRHSGTESPIAIFDFNLRFGYKEWSDQGSSFDIRALQGRGLVQAGGVQWERIVHFVENHDFDRNNYQNQALQEGHSPIFGPKSLMYAHMLALPGQATLWYRDLFWYGSKLRDDIALLTHLRSLYFSGSYEVLTARGDVFFPGNANDDPKNLMVIQRGGDSDETGAIIAINKGNTKTSTWVTSSKWANQKVYDITGNSSDTLDVFNDSRVQINAPANGFSVWVPVGRTLDFTVSANVIDFGTLRTDYLVGDVINPEFGIKSESFFSIDSVNYGVELLKPSGEKVIVLDTLALLKSFDSQAITIRNLILDEVGQYNLSAWLIGLDSDTVKVEFSVADTTNAPSFRMDGQFNESSYKLLVERETGTTGFGPNKVVNKVYYGFSDDTLYFGLEGKFVLGEGDGIGFMLDVNGLDGLAAGSNLGKTEGATGFLNPADTTNAKSVFDFEIDLGFNFLSATTTTADVSVANYSQPDSGGVRLQALAANGLTSIEGPKVSSALPINSLRYSIDFTTGEKKGIELAIAASALKKENFDKDLIFRFFTFIVSGTAYYSDVMIPGEWTGKKDTFGNPGFNTDFASALTGGPYHSSWFGLNGNEVTDTPIETMVEAAKSYRLHPVWPNPFNPSTTIRYDLARSGQVRLSVLNVLGQEIQVITNEKLNAGTFSLNWNASRLASGVYFLRLQTKEGIQIQKMTLLK